jgi:hypothetical protein
MEFNSAFKGLRDICGVKGFVAEAKCAFWYKKPYGLVESHPNLGGLVSIATGFGLDGPGIESRWGQIFPHLSRSALEHTQPPVQQVRGLSQG